MTEAEIDILKAEIEQYKQELTKAIGREDREHISIFGNLIAETRRTLNALLESRVTGN